MGVVLRIMLLSGLFMDRLKAILEPAGLATWEYDVLSALRRAGAGVGVRPTELCKSAQLTSGAMTHRLDRLEERGLLRREAGERDRRSIDIFLTARGKRLVEGIIGDRMVDAAECLGALKKKERGDLARLLRIVSTELERED